LNSIARNDDALNQLQDLANRLFSVEIMGFELQRTIWQRRDLNSLLLGSTLRCA
jgi:hypothetical protein